MIKKSPFLVLMCLLLVFSCGKPETPPSHEGSKPAQIQSKPSSELDQQVQWSAPIQRSRAPQSEPDADVELKRFIAVRHDVVVETSEGELSKGWETVNEFCQTIRCEIISANFRQKTPDSPPSAAIKLRVAPEDIKQLFVHLGKVGTVLEHQTQSEDLTDTVIDVEAKIKNLTELRDRLRKMLASRPGALKDVMEMERELFRAQSQLDSLQMRRKVLAHKTEKISVDISFRARKSVAKTGTFAPIVSAWYDSIHILAKSIAIAITLVVAIVPWLVLFAPLLWIASRVIKRLRAKRINDHKKLIHPNEP